jgi:hypothetical protein
MKYGQRNLQFHNINFIKMSSVIRVILKVVLAAMMIYGLFACQPDTTYELAERKAEQQYVQSKEIREMRAKAMEGFVRRCNLRREAMQVAASVDTLTWFFLGTDHPDYSRLPLMDKRPPVKRSNTDIFKFLQYGQ